MSYLKDICKVNPREALEIVSRAITEIRKFAQPGDDELHWTAGSLELAYICLADVVLDAGLLEEP